MKIALYYTRPFETGGVEKTMYERGKYLSEHGYNVTFVYASEDSPLDMLEKWSEVGNVKHLDICQDEIFDWDLILNYFYQNSLFCHVLMLKRTFI